MARGSAKELADLPYGHQENSVPFPHHFPHPALKLKDNVRGWGTGPEEGSRRRSISPLHPSSQVRRRLGTFGPKFIFQAVSTGPRRAPLQYPTMGVLPERRCPPQGSQWHSPRIRKPFLT